MGLANRCTEYRLYEKTSLIRIYGIDPSKARDFQFRLLGHTSGRPQALPDIYIEDEDQKPLLERFQDELSHTWSYAYGVIELRGAFISLPWPMHRYRTGIFSAGVGDSPRCLCQPRYLLSYLSTFLPVKTELDSAIMLLLPYYENYYHWTIETFPRLKMILDNKEYNDIPIVVPKRRLPRFVMESLALSGVGDRVMSLENGAYKVGRLIIPTLFAPRSRPSEEVVSWLNERILLRDVETDRLVDDSFDRIYISREDAATRSVINSIQVDDLLKRYGIRKVRMTDYSVHEQAKIISKAKLIIGLHGAALANVVYARPESTFVELFMQGLFTKAFYNLARFKKARYGCLLCKQIDGNIFVNTRGLESLVRSALA